jgi:flagellar biosynthesis/type III secretory pathway protein FliH
MVVKPEEKSVLKLGDIIDRIQRSEGSIKTLEEARQEGYLEGFADGKKEGFAEGIAWIKGK